MRFLKDRLKDVRAIWRSRVAARGLPYRPVTSASALIVAPHPDDEVLGVGGLIALKRQAGVAVNVIYLTSGEASLKRFPRISEAAVTSARRQLAVTSAGILGLTESDLSFLGVPDGRLGELKGTRFAGVAQLIAAEIDRCKPQEVYCPHLSDGLPDHEAASRIVSAALQGIARPPRVNHYIVWAWYNVHGPFAERIGLDKAWKIDIRRALEKKRASTREYLSAASPCGHPWCGYLPYGVTGPANAAWEAFVESL